jgi:hypothetical protein
MLRIYYQIWADAIKRARQQPGNRDNWAFMCMFLMSIAMATNLILFMTILQEYILGYYFYQFHIPDMPNFPEKVIRFIILFMLPCLIINYFFIFRNNRYKVFLNKYKFYQGKLFLTYFTISVLLPVILLWIGIIFFR